MSTKQNDDFDEMVLENELMAADRELEDSLGSPGPAKPSEGLRPLPTTTEEANECLDRLRVWRDQSKRDGEFLGLPDWQSIGVSFGIIASTSAESHDNGRTFIAVARLMRGGDELACATGAATNGERIGGRALAASSACGLAQTRAASRAYSNLFRWIAVLGGYEQTPMEEMPVDQEQVKPGPDEEKAVREDLKRGPGIKPENAEAAWAAILAIADNWPDSEWLKFTALQFEGRSFTYTKKAAKEKWEKANKFGNKKGFVFQWLRRAEEASRQS